jgi:hypothetical protein
MNQISEIREEVKKYFDPLNFVSECGEVSISPSGVFRLETSVYKQTKPNTNWEVTKVVILNNGTNEIIFDFFSNHGQLFYSWITANNTEYLVCAEDIYGGQTVVDLTNRVFSSFSLNVDGYISKEFYLSPNGRILATIGCFWACPYSIKLFDFCDPMNLPLREIKEIELLDVDELSLLGWSDDQTLKTKGRLINIKD